jgi:hypothetical protein
MAHGDDAIRTVAAAIVQNHTDIVVARPTCHENQENGDDAKR